MDRFINLPDVVASYVVREKAQYRLLMADGSQMTATFIGNQARFSRQRFPHQLRAGAPGAMPPAMN